MAKLTRKQKNRLEKLRFKISPDVEKPDLAYHYSERLEKRVSKRLSLVSRDSLELARYIKNLESNVTEALVSRDQVTTSVKKDILELIDALKISIYDDTKKRHQEYLGHIEQMKSLLKLASEANLNLKKEFDGKTVSTRKHIKRRIDEIVAELERIGNLRPNAWGGSSRTFYLNGAPISTRYSDINLIPGSGITITEVDNETTLRADVTITSTGGTGSGYQQPTSGALGQSTFTWTVAPNVIVVDGVPKQKVSSDETVNWTGTLTTVLSVDPTFDIFSSA